MSAPSILWDLFENSAVAQEGAEGLAEVGFLLALAEAAQLSGTSPQRVVEVATGALLGV